MLATSMSAQAKEKVFQMVKLLSLSNLFKVQHQAVTAQPFKASGAHFPLSTRVSYTRHASRQMLRDHGVERKTRLGITAKSRSLVVRGICAHILYILSDMQVNVLAGTLCISVSGHKCKFPFEYNGKLQSSCIKGNQNYFWCVTEAGTQERCYPSPNCVSVEESNLVVRVYVFVLFLFHAIFFFFDLTHLCTLLLPCLLHSWPDLLSMLLLYCQVRL